ncbi:hypothetical protein ACQ86G_03860 [Roseateles chitinivorans]|uniref:hypothetical protein n=1 Tax=Roseateles chitinivorans TaxID=2917965 RepID=UPI003D67AFD1
MTVAIAIVLPDSAITITDGRRTKVETGKVERDDMNKIVAFPEASCQVTVFGVTVATGEAVRLLQASPLPPDGVVVRARAAAALELGWSTFCRVHRDIPFGLPGIKAGLLVTGIDDFGPYLVASKIDGPHAGERFHRGPFYETGAQVALGLSNEIDERFGRRLRESGLIADPSISAPKRADLIAKLAAEEICAESRINPTVGGVVRYRAVLRSGLFCFGIV